MVVFQVVELKQDGDEAERRSPSSITNIKTDNTADSLRYAKLAKKEFEKNLRIK